MANAEQAGRLQAGFSSDTHPSRSGGRFLLVLIAVALALPLLVGQHFGLPRVHSGDEPHYMVIINSLIRDGDLDLANNYAAVHAGQPQAGQGFAGSGLDHHTAWFEHGQRRIWDQVYERDTRLWEKDADGHEVPRLRAGVPAPAPGHPEYSAHPAGLAIVLAPLLVGFRNTAFVEPLAIACAAVATILALLFYCALLKKYSPDLRVVYAAAAVAFLGTPAWLYARSLFGEPYMMLCAIGAYSLVLRGKSPLLAGCLIGIGLLIKPPFAIVIFPLVVVYLMERRVAAMVQLVVPVAAATAIYLALNAHMFGSPFAAAQPWRSGSLIDGVVGSLLSPRWGYIFCAPAIIVAFMAWPAFFRAHRRDAAVLGAGALIHFLLYASYGSWSGAGAYSARYVLPIVPLVFVPLVMWPELWNRPSRRPLIAGLCAVSILANGVAAWHYGSYWDTNILREAFNDTLASARMTPNKGIRSVDRAGCAGDACQIECNDDEVMVSAVCSGDPAAVQQQPNGRWLAKCGAGGKAIAGACMQR